MDAKQKTTMSVPEMRRMLGLGKTDSYWLVHKKYFETIMVQGKMRVVIESFEKWYANQIKHKKVDGPPPGAELKAYSYSIPEMAKILGVSDYTAYDIVSRYNLETFEVDYWRRIRKDVFERWYQNQTRYRTSEDKKRDSKIEEESMTMPEIARLLLITRSEVYQILNAARNQGVFQVIMVADKKRIMKDSFEKWYSGQSKYKKLCDRSPEEQAEIMALQNCEETCVEKQEQKFLDKTVYTPQEVAELLDITYKDVLAMIKAGDIDTLKHGNKYLIHRDEIQWFLFQKKLQMNM